MESGCGVQYRSVCYGKFFMLCCVHEEYVPQCGVFQLPEVSHKFERGLAYFLRHFSSRAFISLFLNKPVVLTSNDTQQS